MSGDHGGGGPSDSKKNIAVIIASIAMLLAMAIAVFVGVTSTKQSVYVEDHGEGYGEGHGEGHDEEHGEGHDDEEHHEDSNVVSSHKAVKSLCQPTDYRKVCEDALSHSNSSDPKQLILDSFNVTIEKIESALIHADKYRAGRNDPRTIYAIETCKEVMEYALTNLKKSGTLMEKFETKEFAEFGDRVRIWLSGALTFHETCFDSFDDASEEVGDKMKHLFNESRELTSDGLTMVTELSVMSGATKGDEPEIKHTSHRHITETKVAHHAEPDHAESNHDEPKEHEQHDEAKPKEVYPYWVEIGKKNLLQSPSTSIEADVVVAKDGSGKYETITEALKDVPVSDPTDVNNSANKTFVIYIKPGIYEEQVRIEANMTNVMFVGDGPSTTTIVSNKSYEGGFVLYKTATVAIMGSNFIARGITFENSSPLEKHQAVALLVQSDMSIFYQCRINGTNSALFAHSHRQFYRQSVISGTVDFIFGDAAAVFQSCGIVIKKPLEDEECYVAAQGRLDHKENTGFVFHNCTFSADPLYQPLRHKNKAYFGRPWKKYSQTMIMQSFVDDSITPHGWASLNGDFGAKTCFFAEFENRGPGSVTSGRVKWPGVNVNVSATDAEQFTAGKFLEGDKWVRPSQVPYESAMIEF